MQVGKYIRTEEINRKSSLSKIGNRYFLGKHHSLETRKRLSEGRKGRFVGEKHPNWKGGIAHLPYSVNWTKTLKRSIRERDKYICRLCGEQQEEISFDVHHIDYDKKNCNPNNLITLCDSCHTKTNYNREKWELYFTNLIS